jgi:carbamoyl-phosphate synthase large subunit
MKSTGEVMGIDSQFGLAYAKAQLGAGQRLPTTGTVFISVKDSDKPGVLPVAAGFKAVGFNIMATRGTGRLLTANNIANDIVKKVSMGRPHVVDAIKNGEVHLVINTGQGETPRQDGYRIRRAAIKFGIPYATTLAGASAMCRGIAALKSCQYGVQALQDYHG